MKIFASRALIVIAILGGQLAVADDAKISLKMSHLVDYSGEGPSATRAYVMMGRTKIAMREPTACTINSTSEELSIDVGGRDLSGDIQVTHSSISPRLGFEPSTIETYSDAALAVIASHVKNVKAESVRANPYVGFDWKGIAIQFIYDFAGRRYRREIAFVNIDESNQLMVSVRAREEDFDRVLGIATEFLGSWYPMRENTKETYN